MCLFAVPEVSKEKSTLAKESDTCLFAVLEVSKEESLLG